MVTTRAGSWSARTAGAPVQEPAARALRTESGGAAVLRRSDGGAARRHGRRGGDLAWGARPAKAGASRCRPTRRSRLHCSRCSARLALARLRACSLSPSRTTCSRPPRSSRASSRFSPRATSPCSSSITRRRSYVTVPLLALADAGIAIDGDFLERAADSPSTLGVLVGYAAGKPLGVVGTAWLSRGDCDRRSAGAPSQAQAQAVAAPAARRRASSRRAGGTGLGGRRRSGRVLADARPAARAPGQAADGRSGVVRRPTRARRGALHRGPARARCGEADRPGTGRARTGAACPARPRSSSTGTAATARTTWTLCRSPRRRRPRQAGGGVALTCLVGYRPSSRSGCARLAVGLGWSGPGGQAVPRRARKICGSSRQGRSRRSPSTKKVGVAWTPALRPPSMSARTRSRNVCSRRAASVSARSSSSRPATASRSSCENRARGVRSSECASQNCPCKPASSDSSAARSARGWSAGTGKCRQTRRRPSKRSKSDFTGRLAWKQYGHPKSPYSTSVSFGLLEPVT